MTADPPATLVIAICPSCGETVETKAQADETGVLHAQPASLAVIREHHSCDLWAISIALSAAAFRLSKVTVFKLKGDGES